MGRDVLTGSRVTDDAGGKGLCRSSGLAGRLHIDVQIIEALDERRLLNCRQRVLVRYPLFNRVELQEALAGRRFGEHALFLVTQLQGVRRLFGYLILI